jgi:hypothetical protein
MQMTAFFTPSKHLKIFFEKICKKVLTSDRACGNIFKLSHETAVVKHLLNFKSIG